MIENSDTLRDAVRFVVAAWPSRAPEEKERFETMWLDDTRHPDEQRKKQWRRMPSKATETCATEHKMGSK
ncbi:hypothetical protein [Rhodovulum sulfidophilum]|uniref:hypothetical protein n=1 Tax=Rhodovulum sulfidophilum TaxID=35806 RepID=UPI001389D601|nr:hypothetical protein [Rhodovulum sulfidophilum]NDK36927.1 hypothetical protein [Rhodovulum sulfidophilum]